MSSQNAGVVYLPVAHAATTQEAVLKHRHKLEICLAKAGLYILNVITLQFIKQGSSLQDRRKNTQQALFVVTSDHKDDGAWTKSHVWERQTIPSVPLIRVSEMVGYDPESKPGAAARVEQMLVYFNCCFLCHWKVGDSHVFHGQFFVFFQLDPVEKKPANLLSGGAWRPPCTC